MKLKNYITLALFALTLVSLVACTAEEPGGTPNRSTHSTAFVIPSLPGYAEPSGTRAIASDIGVQDPGKTKWENRDTLMIKVRFYDEADTIIGRAFAYNIYVNGNWQLGDGLNFTKNNDKNLPEAIRDAKIMWPRNAKKMNIEAIYAPHQVFANDTLLYTAKPVAVGQCPMWKASVTSNTPGEDITFTKWKPACIRIRVAAAPYDEVKLAAPLFEPVGSRLGYTLEAIPSADGSGKHPEEPVGSIRTRADKKGNAYFYGSWKSQTTFTVSLTESTAYAYAETKVFERSFDSSLNGSISHFAINSLVGSKMDGIKDWDILGADDLYVGSVESINKNMNRWCIDEAEPNYAKIAETLEAVKQADPNRSISLVLPLVKSVKNDAFSGCESLTSISLPAALEIGSNAFSGCKALSYVNLPVATIIKSNAFQYCDSLRNIYLPKVKKIESTVFILCQNLAHVNAPSVTSIDGTAFSGCRSLTSVTLNSAETLGDYVFANCSTLSTLTLPKVKNLGNEVFNGCDSLTKLSFWSVIEKCNSGAFANVKTENITLTIHPDQPGAEAPNKFNGYTFKEIKRYQSTL